MNGIINLKCIHYGLAVFMLSSFGINVWGQEQPIESQCRRSTAYVVNAEDSTLSVIDMKSNEVTRTVDLNMPSMSQEMDGSKKVEWPHHIYLNSKKTQLAIAVPGVDLSMGHEADMPEMKGMVLVVSTLPGGFLKSFEVPMMNHNAIFSPDGAEIWTSQMEDSGKVLVYDSHNYRLKNTIPVGKRPSEVTFSANGKVAFVANTASNSVTAIDVPRKSVRSILPVGDAPIGAWMGSNQKMYVDNEKGKSISVVDVPTLSVEETVTLGFTPGMAAYHPQLKELWVSDTDGGRVVYFQRSNQKWIQGGSIPTGEGAHAVAFSRDGKTAYISNQMAASVTVVNVVSKKEIKSIPVGNKPNGITLLE